MSWQPGTLYNALGEQSTLHQALVSKDREPITPFISKIRALAARGVSTVLVIGGCGDFFDVADTVIAADSFRYQARVQLRLLELIPKHIRREQHLLARVCTEEYV